MIKDEAVNTIWNYMHMNHELKKADVILVLGSHDTRVAEYAADLFLQGYAPVILFSGSGTVHKNEVEWKGFVGGTEAEVFAEIAKKKGVPENQILVENESQNTGDNFKLSLEILRRNNIPTNTLIAVQKPYMERRTYATGKIHLPKTELIVTSPNIALKNYNDGIHATDKWVETMVGDLLRIKEYPAKGFQIEQKIPNEVWRAYEFLAEQGYDKRPIQK